VEGQPLAANIDRVVQALEVLGQDALEGGIVAVVGEEGEACVGAIQGVIDQSAFGDTERSAHAPNGTRGARGVKNRFLTPGMWRSEVLKILDQQQQCGQELLEVIA
jgi:hypothetical protein